MRLLGRGFHTLIRSVSFSSPTDVRSHIIHLGTTVNNLLLGSVAFSPLWEHKKLRTCLEVFLLGIVYKRLLSDFEDLFEVLSPIFVH